MQYYYILLLFGCRGKSAGGLRGEVPVHLSTKAFHQAIQRSQQRKREVSED